MSVTRRQFLDMCKNAGIGLGLIACVGELETVLANSSAPTVIWLQGAACTGCSVSLMNRISNNAPTTVGDLLINTINLRYHPTLMGASGQDAAAVADDALAKGNYILAVEGGVPTAFGGATCFAWTKNGQDVTFLDAVKSLSSKASQILAIGTCASFGGVPAAGPNPTGIQTVKAATGKTTINIAGCPTHPDWIVWAISQILLGKKIATDSNGRPTALYPSSPVHQSCPRRSNPKASTYGIDLDCMRNLGCRGPYTSASCPSSWWNNAVNWCTNSNSQCIGCTEPNFPLAGVRRPSGN